MSLRTFRALIQPPSDLIHTEKENLSVNGENFLEAADLC